VRAPDAPDDPARDEDLEDLGEELAWQVQRRSEVLQRGDPPVREPGEVDHRAQRIIDLAADLQDVLHP